MVPRGAIRSSCEGEQSRTIAILLAIFTVGGVGHFYAGLTRRAAFWLVALNVAGVLAAVISAAGYAVDLGLPCA